MSQEAPTPPRDRRFRLRPPSWTGRAAGEGLLIVFSVILALAVTDWADRRRTAHRVEEMRQFLVTEIRANRDELARDDYVPHHNRLKRVFARAGGTPDGQTSRVEARTAADQLFGGGGLHLMAPRDAVWSSVSGGDLFEHMKPEEVFLLARVYRAQESLESVNRAGYENALGVLDILSDQGDRHRQMLRMTLYFEDLIQQETHLLRLYDEALAELAPAAAKRTDDGRAATR